MASYIFNEFKFSETTKAQIAGRIEHVIYTGTAPDFIHHLRCERAWRHRPPIARSPDFTPKSASVGLIQNLPWNLVGSITAQHVERAPKPAELFSRGPHDATATFDIGNPNLADRESPIRSKPGCGAPPGRSASSSPATTPGSMASSSGGSPATPAARTLASPAPGEELKQAVYSQRDAIFRGIEFQSQYEVAPLWTGVWGIENQFDVVRATFTDGTNVPRIPPVRIGGGLFYRDSNWLARVNLLHAFPQNDIALIGETPTAGYNTAGRDQLSLEACTDHERWLARDDGRH